MAASETAPTPAAEPAAWRGGRIEYAFARTVFPVTLAASIAVSLLAMKRGLSPPAAIGVGSLGAYVVVVLGERLFPHHASWNRSRRDVRVDVAFALTIAGVVPLVQLAMGPLAAALGAALSRGFGSTLWPSGLPLLVQLVLALVIAELPKYALHRLQHEWDPLWRFHATHHSVPRLYWLNASRFHPVDIGLDTFVGLLPLVALGCGAEVLALFFLVSGVHGIFQHANMQLRCGPLNWFFSMAELHRWHHSRTVVEANHNYGQNLIVWDIVFGTRFLPADREPPEDIGLANLPNFPTRFFALLASPFRWRAIRREAESG